MDDSFEQKDSDTPSALNGVFGDVDLAWKHLVSPPKHPYSLEGLGPQLQIHKGITYNKSELTFTNKKQLSLRYSLYKPIEETPRDEVTVVYFHSHGSCRLEGYPLLSSLARYGFSLVLLDFAGSGWSEGEIVTMGFQERYDIIQLMGILEGEHNLKNFVLWGRSMGAAAILLAYQGLKLERMLGLVLDSPFSSVERVYRNAVKKVVNVPDFLIDIVYRFARVKIKEKYNFDLSELRPLENAKGVLMPTAIIGSKIDKIVDFEDLQKMVQGIGCAEKQLFECEGTHLDDRPTQTLEGVVDFLHGLYSKKMEVLNRYYTGERVKQSPMSDRNGNRAGLTTILRNNSQIEYRKGARPNNLNIINKDAALLNRLEQSRVIRGGGLQENLKNTRSRQKVNSITFAGLKKKSKILNKHGRIGGVNSYLSFRNKTVFGKKGSHGNAAFGNQNQTPTKNIEMIDTFGGYLVKKQRIGSMENQNNQSFGDSQIQIPILNPQKKRFEQNKDLLFTRNKQKNTEQGRPNQRSQNSPNRQNAINLQQSYQQYQKLLQNQQSPQQTYQQQQQYNLINKNIENSQKKQSNLQLKVKQQQQLQIQQQLQYQSYKKSQQQHQINENQPQKLIDYNNSDLRSSQLNLYNNELQDRSTSLKQTRATPQKRIFKDSTTNSYKKLNFNRQNFLQQDDNNSVKRLINKLETFDNHRPIFSPRSLRDRAFVKKQQQQPPSTIHSNVDLSSKNTPTKYGYQHNQVPQQGITSIVPENMLHQRIDYSFPIQKYIGGVAGAPGGGQPLVNTQKFEDFKLVGHTNTPKYQNMNSGQRNQNPKIYLQNLLPDNLRETFQRRKPTRDEPHISVSGSMKSLDAFNPTIETNGIASDEYRNQPNKVVQVTQKVQIQSSKPKRDEESLDLLKNFDFYKKKLTINNNDNNNGNNDPKQNPNQSFQRSFNIQRAANNHQQSHVYPVMHITSKRDIRASSQNPIIEEGPNMISRVSQRIEEVPINNKRVRQPRYYQNQNYLNSSFANDTSGRANSQNQNNRPYSGLNILRTSHQVPKVSKLRQSNNQSYVFESKNYFDDKDENNELRGSRRRQYIQFSSKQQWQNSQQNDKSKRQRQNSFFVEKPDSFKANNEYLDQRGVNTNLNQVEANSTRNSIRQRAISPILMASPSSKTHKNIFFKRELALSLRPSLNHFDADGLAMESSRKTMMGQLNDNREQTINTRSPLAIRVDGLLQRKDNNDHQNISENESQISRNLNQNEFIKGQLKEGRQDIEQKEQLIFNKTQGEINYSNLGSQTLFLTQIVIIQFSFLSIIHLQFQKRKNRLLG